MKTLKNCIKLSSVVKIYIPSTINVNEEIDSTIHTDRALTFLSGLFGGATSTPALGAWMTQGGGLIKERVTIVFAYADTLGLSVHIDDIYNYCLCLKRELNQEAIALEINGELYLI